MVRISNKILSKLNSEKKIGDAAGDTGARSAGGEGVEASASASGSNQFGNSIKNKKARLVSSEEGKALPT